MVTITYTIKVCDVEFNGDKFVVWIETNEKTGNVQPTMCFKDKKIFSLIDCISLADYVIEELHKGGKYEKV